MSKTHHSGQRVSTSFARFARSNSSWFAKCIALVVLLAGITWTDEARAGCVNPGTDKVLVIKDQKRRRTLTNKAQTSTIYTGEYGQTWKVLSAGTSDNCSYFYLVEREGNKYLIAGDKKDNDKTYIEAPSTKANAKWKFETTGVEGVYRIMDQLAGRTLIADAGGSSALSAFTAGRFSTSDENAQWYIKEYSQDCNTLAGRTTGAERGLVFLKDGLRERTVTNEAQTNSVPTYRKSEQWEIKSAGKDSSGIEYYYIIEQEEGKYLTAGDTASNDNTFMQANAATKDNAKWRFDNVGSTSCPIYRIKDKLGNRSLVTNDGPGNALSAYDESRVGYTDMNAQWRIGYHTLEPECKSILTPIDNSTNHRIVEISYNNNNFNIPKYESAWGYDVAHTQGSTRLPDKGSNAYFMFSGSEDGAGAIWVVQVPKNADGSLSTQNAIVVWRDKLDGGCSSQQDCNRHETRGNFNHPAQMALVPYGNMVAVAFQNYEAQGYLGMPGIRGADSLGFYSVANPAAPTFLFKFVGNHERASHWGGAAPGNPATIKNVSINYWPFEKSHFMAIVPGYHYIFKDTSRLNPSSTGRDIAQLTGGTFSSKKGHGYTTDMVGTANPLYRLLDVNFSGGDVDATVVDTGNNVVRSCYYGFIDRYKGCTSDDCRNWRHDGCDKAGGFSNNWNSVDTDKGKVNFICHHKKPENKKFIVMDLK